MTSDSDRRAIDAYLERLRRGLRRLPAAEREEVVAEIHGHVLERLETRGDQGGGAVAQVLSAVGDPDRLGAQYETDALLRRAAESRSPWLLLRATMSWARRGVRGIGALLLAVAGYGVALVCYVSAVAKPVFPSRIGMWLSPGSTVTVGYWSGRLPSELIGLSLRPPASLIVLGTFGPTPGPVRELLGMWLIPVGIVAGFLCAFATTWCLRKLVRRAAESRPLATA